MHVRTDGRAWNFSCKLGDFSHIHPKTQTPLRATGFVIVAIVICAFLSDLTTLAKTAMGSEYWKNLTTFLQKTMLEHGTIDERDTHIAKMTDDSEEALELVRIQCIGQQI